MKNPDAYPGINLEVVLPEMVLTNRATEIGGNKMVMSSHPMVTRSKTGSPRPKVFVNNMVRGSIKEPTSVAKAISDERSYNAMKKDFQALKRNQTWELVPFSKRDECCGS